MPERQGKPMQIAVCDDNPLFLKEISAQLEDLHIAERVNVFSCLHTFFSSLEEVNPYDVVLMDIDWRQDETGMDVAEKLAQITPRTKIIYVTGYNDRFSQQIFLHRANLSGYLVKPVDSELLRANLVKVRKELKEQDEPLLTLSSRGKPVFVPHREILYLESLGHTVNIHTAEEQITVYARLNNILQLLPDGFIQCHKSFVVNMRQIRRFQAPDILLKNGAKIPVSRNRYAETKSAYFKFMGQTF